MKLTVIYRCSEEDSKRQHRPPWFSKWKCLNNFLDIFKYADKILGVNIEIIAVHDGPRGLLHDFLEFNDISIQKINIGSNAGSLDYCLKLATNLDTDIIYFLEDDYLHVEYSPHILLDGFDVAKTLKKSHIVSLYDHADRYHRVDDIDYGQTNVLLGSWRHWRTAESTTCTWAVSKETYMNDVYDLANKFSLDDRGLFRALRTKDTVLFTPITGASTHCHLPFMSPLVEWSKV